MAFSKSKKHYIGVVWADGDKKGGIALQADKNEFRGLLAALEGVTGKKAVDTDATTEAASKSGLAIPTTAAATDSTPRIQAQAAPTQAPPVTTASASTVSAQAVAPAAKAVSQTVPSRPSPPTSAPAVSARSEPMRIIPAASPSVPASSRQPDALVTHMVDVTFASNPPGAEVFFAGMPFNRTPFVTKLLPGTYPVEFKLTGYPDWENDITVDAGKPTTVVAQLNSTTGVVLK